MLLGSDGLQYEDITARLLGKPVENDRNRQILRLKATGHKAGEIEAWSVAYDKARGQHPDKVSASWKALDKYRHITNRGVRQSRSPGRDGVPNPVQAPAAALHPAN